MTRREFWEQLSETGWNAMAKDYLSAIENETPATTKVELIATEMRFEAPFDKLWKFILLSLSMAETDRQFGQMGAGEIEHLLGWQEKWDGADYIALVEKESKTNGRLNRALLDVLKYAMTDDVWVRVQHLQEQIKSEQLPLYGIK
jgi:hypothetical protein